MPRGGLRDSRGKKSKKGQRRHFTDEEALKNEEEKQEREKNWRRRQGGGSDDEGGASGKKSDSESSSYESSSDEDDIKKGKGVDGLIEIQNPNRAVKQSKKVTDIDADHKTVLSRREREELEKTEAKRRYDQLHMEGKTTEAQSDLARLAIIRKQREEQAKKREQEKKELEDKKKVKGKGLS